MSKIGKQPIEIKDDIKVDIKREKVLVQGPKGKLETILPRGIKVVLKENNLIVEPKKVDSKSRALWGTIRALIFNNIVGVSKGFEKTLIIEGIGYKAEIKGNELVLHVGYSHPVSVQIPENLNVSVEKNVIKVSGISKQEVGDFAAKIKKVRKTNPYSGKGIKYTGEYVIRKSGKKLAGK